MPKQSAVEPYAAQEGAPHAHAAHARPELDPGPAEPAGGLSSARDGAHSGAQGPTLTPWSPAGGQNAAHAGHPGSLTRPPPTATGSAGSSSAADAGHPCAQVAGWESHPRPEESADRLDTQQESAYAGPAWSGRSPTEPGASLRAAQAGPPGCHPPSPIPPASSAGTRQGPFKNLWSQQAGAWARRRTARRTRMWRGMAHLQGMWAPTPVPRGPAGSLSAAQGGALDALVAQLVAQPALLRQLLQRLLLDPSRAATPHRAARLDELREAQSARAHERVLLPDGGPSQPEHGLANAVGAAEEAPGPGARQDESVGNARHEALSPDRRLRIPLAAEAAVPPLARGPLVEPQNTHCSPTEWSACSQGLGRETLPRAAALQGLAARGPLRPPCRQALPAAPHRGCRGPAEHMTQNPKHPILTPLEAGRPGPSHPAAVRPRAASAARARVGQQPRPLREVSFAFSGSEPDPSHPGFGSCFAADDAAAGAACGKPTQRPGRTGRKAGSPTCTRHGRECTTAASHETLAGSADGQPAEPAAAEAGREGQAGRMRATGPPVPSHPVAEASGGVGWPGSPGLSSGVGLGPDGPETPRPQPGSLYQPRAWDEGWQAGESGRRSSNGHAPPSEARVREAVGPVGMLGAQRADVLRPNGGHQAACTPGGCSGPRRK